MNGLSKLKGLGLALVFVAAPALADTKDAWLTTKSKIALLTASDVSVTAVNVDTVGGNVTLHGKVKSQAEKAKAEVVVKGVDGVRSVHNLLEVVPDAFKDSVKAADSAIKDGVEKSLKTANMDNVKVASVNNGVVLLSGETPSLDMKLRAIETAWSVSGVKRVASEIKAEEK